ncbi:conserved hypothetical protein [Candidatus Defluviicoccus seviourii]|uniref:Tox-GHH2 domain-containing protein n=1 Tax=Candidatus Defluviicoccus seviourii TaxID=2565273 RepID=A0A564WBJ3_9PROT|nr:conserved hypothetical protein [Candidatus Defluviicoccus seviourii]
MANDVFANGMEIACKSGDAKVIAAFPDVCLSPPSPPAGPIPVPYPITSQASDTTDGSKTVKISGKEIMLKNSSSYKKCMGNDPATKTLGMGVVTHCIQGKTYFVMWSFDVKAEGENVDRHFDTTNSNGMSTGNQVGWVNFDSGTFDSLKDCENVSEEYRLVPYKTGDTYTCGGTDTPTGHHLVPGRLMGKAKGTGNVYPHGNGKCTHSGAPVICAKGRNQYADTHGDMHAFQDPIEYNTVMDTGVYTRDQATTTGAKAAGVGTNGKALSPRSKAFKCVKAQLDSYYEKCGLGPNDPMKATPTEAGKNLSLN